jgi:hypothetical protein
VWWGGVQGGGGGGGGEGEEGDYEEEYLNAMHWTKMWEHQLTPIAVAAGRD